MYRYSQEVHLLCTTAAVPWCPYSHTRWAPQSPRASSASRFFSNWSSFCTKNVKQRGSSLRLKIQVNFYRAFHAICHSLKLSVFCQILMMKRLIENLTTVLRLRLLSNYMTSDWGREMCDCLKHWKTIYSQLEIFRPLSFRLSTGAAQDCTERTVQHSQWCLHCHSRSHRTDRTCHSLHLSLQKWRLGESKCPVWSR